MPISDCTISTISSHIHIYICSFTDRINYSTFGSLANPGREKCYFNIVFKINWPFDSEISCRDSPSRRISGTRGFMTDGAVHDPSVRPQGAGEVDHGLSQGARGSHGGMRTVSLAWNENGWDRTDSGCRTGRTELYCSSQVGGYL